MIVTQSICLLILISLNHFINIGWVKKLVEKVKSNVKQVMRSSCFTHVIPVSQSKCYWQNMKVLWH